MKSWVVAAIFGVGLLSGSTAASAQGWVFCANEHEFCGAPPGAVIHYGRNGAFTHRRNHGDGLPCENEVFGDPLVGIHKQCFFSY